MWQWFLDWWFGEEDEAVVVDDESSTHIGKRDGGTTIWGSMISNSENPVVGEQKKS